MDKEREEFEKDAASRGMIMSKNPDGTYRSSMTQPAWLSWQSARAPLLAEIERLNAIKLTVEALDDRDKDAWGRGKYKHSHIQALWEGLRCGCNKGSR